MLWVSFFKPMGIFEGSFNKLAAWWTAGEYCHCELVWHVEPVILMGCVRRTYAKIQSSEEDHTKLAAELESVFFQNKDNKVLLQLGKKVYVSFSLLWGDQLRIRFLMNIEDPWFSTPNQSFDDIVWRKCNNIKPEKEKETLEWALGEISKPYNSSAALLSWVPTWGTNDTRPRPSYFCSEFTALCLVRMHFLKPLATHHCTPNHLEAIIRLKEKDEIEVENVIDTLKKTDITLLEDLEETIPNYVESSDEEIETLEAEINK